MQKIINVIVPCCRVKPAAQLLAETFGLRKKRLLESWGKYYYETTREIAKKMRDVGMKKMSIIFDDRLEEVHIYIGYE